MNKRYLVGLAFMCSGLLGTSVSALAMNIQYTLLGGSMDAAALSAFNAAANYWDSALTNNVTIRIEIGYDHLGANIVGQTSSQSSVSSYAAIRGALAAETTSLADTIAVSHLQNTSHLNLLTNDPSNYNQDYAFKANAPFNVNGYLDVNNANLKALGLFQDDGHSSDAKIIMSSDFAFDMNRANGISAQQLDLVGVITHEIGHALGFTSGVDTMDLISSPNGPLRGEYPNWKDYAIFSPLDLYRYSSFSVANQYGLDLSFKNAIAGNSYFSIDGGLTNLAPFETGSYNGEGYQASHWLDNLSLGIMDPTVAYGEQLSITALDLTAMDVIGWNVKTSPTPEPATMLLLGSGLAGLIGARRKKKAQA